MNAKIYFKTTYKILLYDDIILLSVKEKTGKINKKTLIIFTSDMLYFDYDRLI